MKNVKIQTNFKDLNSYETKMNKSWKNVGIQTQEIENSLQSICSNRMNKIMVECNKFDNTAYLSCQNNDDIWQNQQFNSVDNSQFKYSFSQSWFQELKHKNSRLKKLGITHSNLLRPFLSKQIANSKILKDQAQNKQKIQKFSINIPKFETQTKNMKQNQENSIDISIQDCQPTYRQNPYKNIESKLNKNDYKQGTQKKGKKPIILAKRSQIIQNSSEDVLSCQQQKIQSVMNYKYKINKNLFNLSYIENDKNSSKIENRKNKKLQQQLQQNLASQKQQFQKFLQYKQKLIDEYILKNIRIKIKVKCLQNIIYHKSNGHKKRK